MCCIADPLLGTSSKTRMSFGTEGSGTGKGCGIQEQKSSFCLLT